MDSVVRDVSSCVESANTAENSAGFAQLLVDSVVDYAIYLLDLDGNLKTWNAGAQRIYGYSATEIVGSNFSVFYTEDDVRAEVSVRSLDIARTTGRFEAEGWRVRKDATRIRVSVVIDAVYNPAGGVVGFAKITRDVTNSAALRRVSEQLRTENEQLLREKKSALEASWNPRKQMSAARSPIGVKFGFLGVLLCASFAVALYLCARTYGPIIDRSHDEAQAHTVAGAAAEALEQWTLEDNALDMYAALIALRDPAQHRLAETTAAQARDSRQAINLPLESIERVATDSYSLTLLARIRHDLTMYDGYTARMLLLAKRGDIRGTVRIQSVDNTAVSVDVTNAFAALRTRESERAEKANDDVNTIASFGARPMVPIAALMLVLTIFVLTVVGRSITGPLRRLTMVAQKVAAGDVDVEADLPQPGRDEVGALSGSFREMVLKRRQVEERLVFAAFHDELTGLANRAMLMDHLHQVVAKRDAGAHLWAILFLDLDRFKVVNDSLGHVVGDLVLIEAARRLERCLRSGDMLARIGGDEFVIFLDDVADVPAASAVAGRVLREFDSAFTVAGSEVLASTSIGIAMSQSSDDRPEDVLRNADIAMYRAKELGKRRYELFTPELLKRAVARHEVETDLGRALERKEFCLYYQPIISLRDGRLTGFEALVRWRHPRRGLVNPDEFISLAEETGAIVAIGEWILREACRQLQAWRATFGVAHDLRMNVNVSARQLATPLFARTVESALSESW
jgi:diguanylate cyclase (GGDEF)-like protein/PAS domain S-box-containing protein